MLHVRGAPGTSQVKPMTNLEVELCARGQKLGEGDLQLLAVGASHKMHYPGFCNYGSVWI